MGEIAFGLLIRIEGAVPEFLIFRASASPRDNHGQGGFAFPEIVADGLADHRGGATIIQGVINDLEGEAEILAIRRECGGILFAFNAQRRARRLQRRLRTERPSWLR